jgi:hypothetical protein
MVTKIVHIFEATVKFVEQSVADLSEQQMIKQPKGVPNHGKWTLGHIIFSCQGIAIELDVEPWLPGDWELVYGYGSTPLPDSQQYPKKSELLTMLSDAKSRLCQTLLTLNESTLEKSLPDEMFSTMGHLLLQVVIAHTAYHAGQLAIWRRAIGKQPVGVFV